MYGGHTYIPLDNRLLPPAKNVIDDIHDESYADAKKWCPYPRCSQIAKTGFQTFEMQHQRRIIRQQRYLEVLRNRAVGLFANYVESAVADGDVACQRKHHHIVNPRPAGSLANRKCSGSHPAVN
jgi:hypothetical protein